MVDSTLQTYTACPRYPLDLKMTRLSVNLLQFEWTTPPSGERKLWSSPDFLRGWVPLSPSLISSNGNERIIVLTIEIDVQKRFFELRKP